MKKWGEKFFDQVFQKCDFNPNPHFLYQEAAKTSWKLLSLHTSTFLTIWCP